MGQLNCNRLWNGYASALAYAELIPTIMLCIAARIINLKRVLGVQMSLLVNSTQNVT